MKRETRKEIMFGGFGGQGIITAGYITGQAAAVYDDKDSTLTQVYGPEARGSACHSGVVIDDAEIDYPFPLKPQIMVIMGQDAYEKFLPRLKDGGILIIDSSLVKPDEKAGKYKLYEVPATEVAEKAGAKIVANIVMLGFLARIWDAISVEGMRESVKTRVPKKYLDLNLRVFQEGVRLAEEALQDESAPS